MSKATVKPRTSPTRIAMERAHKINYELDKGHTKQLRAHKTNDELHKTQNNLRVTQGAQNTLRVTQNKQTNKQLIR